MVFLEIEHPNLHRLRWELRDGVHVFPPPELEDSVRGCRMRVQVRGQTVYMASLPDRGVLRENGRIVRQTVLQQDQSVQLDSFRLTLRVGTRTLETAASTGGGNTASLGFGSSLDSEAETGTLRVQGRDRWILVSLLAAGRLGRNDLRRIVTIFRNDWISGRQRHISEILRKGRFFGTRLDQVLDEVDAEWRLGCPRCRREFETDSPVLAKFRCLECDRRLDCAPRRREEPDTDSMNLTLLDSGYDRLAPGTRLGDYKIEQLLGVGGYGAVYKAFDTRIQRTVALKVFPAGREGSADVLREARNVASFPPHPNLVLVYHVGEANNYDYISYEYVSGHSLAYHIDRRTKLPLEEKLRLLRDVLGGLATAHRHGVIHRDMKPDNILLVRVEGQFRARLTDFGLGQRLRRGQGAYHSRTVRGAPEYLAPEQFRTQVSSVASDLYSVGATFFHLLTGEAPFTGATDGELAERHLEDPVPSLADMMIRCPRSLERLFLQLLAKEPKNRPSSAREVLDQLDDVEYELDTFDQTRVSPWSAVALVALSVLLVLGILFGGKLFLSPETKTTAEVAKASRGNVVGARAGPEMVAVTPTSSLTPPAPVVSPPPASTEGVTGLQNGQEPDSAGSGPPAQPDGASTAPVEGADEAAHASQTEPAERLESVNDSEVDPDHGNELIARGDASPVPDLPATDQAAFTNAGDLESEDRSQAPVDPDPTLTASDASPVILKVEGEDTNLEPTMVDEGMIELDPVTAVFAGLSPLDDLPEAMRRVHDWLDDQDDERFRTLDETQQVELRRMQLLMSLLARTAAAHAGDVNGNWERASYLEVGSRRTLVAGTAKGLVDVGLPIYSAQQVRDWLLLRQDELAAWELTSVVVLDLPSPDDLSDDWRRPADEREPCDSLEWVQDADGLVLFDHHTGQVRAASREPEYRRPATVRLKVTVKEPRRLFLRLQGWFEGLAR